MSFSWTYLASKDLRNNNTFNIVLSVLCSSSLLVLGSLCGVGVITGVSLGIGGLSTIGGYIFLSFCCDRSKEKNKASFEKQIDSGELKIKYNPNFFPKGVPGKPNATIL